MNVYASCEKLSICFRMKPIAEGLLSKKLTILCVCVCLYMKEMGWGQDRKGREGEGRGGQGRRED